MSTMADALGMGNLPSTVQFVVAGLVRTLLSGGSFTPSPCRVLEKFLIFSVLCVASQRVRRNLGIVACVRVYA